MRWTLYFVVALLLATFVNGCASCPRIDWCTRVGNYTYNQSVKELGVPDKYQKLSDNSIVAEWALRYCTPDYVTYGYCGGYWGHGWVSPGTGYGYPEGPDYTRWLRLVFGPDAKLTMFKQYDR